MIETHTPDNATKDAAGTISARLPSGRLHLDGIDTPLPEAAAAMLREILAALAAGEPVAVITQESELTPNEAANLLNVSRGFVARLMDEGTLPFRMVGSHRRIPAAAVAVYQAKQKAIAASAMDELVQISQDLGDYANAPTLPPKSAFRGTSGR